jgi:lipoprotein-anchoring transpeptidase ErfK/SrfK
MPNSFLSRRDFLKLGSAGLASLLLAGARLEDVFAADVTGETFRVAYSTVTLFDRPSLDATKLKKFKQDELLSFTEQVTGEDESAYNTVWYKNGDDGYVYSGGIQPVKTIYNRVANEIPDKGVLGEVTIPFVDTYWSPDPRAMRGYRLYYGTTHWIKDIKTGPGRNIYYHLYDDSISAFYYVPANALRIVPAEELSPLSPDVPAQDKFIHVSLNEQMVRAFEGDKLVLLARASTGTQAHATPDGAFQTFHKRATRHMTGGDIAAAGYDLPGVPWVLFITSYGISLHGTYWHNDYGKPHSHGCINLTPEDSKWLYRWTMPSVPASRRYLYLPGEGTLVQISERFEGLRRNQ